MASFQSNTPSGDGSSSGPASKRSYSPPGFTGCDVFKAMVNESKQAVETSLLEFFAEVVTPGTEANLLVSEAAYRVTKPEILLTKIVESVRQNDGTVSVEPMVFGARYPNGTSLPSYGGFTLVLSQSGLEVWGRPWSADMKQEFYRIVPEESRNIARFAQLMAESAVTVGEITRALKREGNYDPRSQTRTLVRSPIAKLPGQLTITDCIESTEDTRFKARQLGQAPNPQLVNHGMNFVLAPKVDIDPTSARQEAPCKEEIAPVTEGVNSNERNSLLEKAPLEKALERKAKLTPGETLALFFTSGVGVAVMEKALFGGVPTLTTLALEAVAAFSVAMVVRTVIAGQRRW